MIEDGGYHAIKGFAFQFDTSLLEIFRNPGREVEIEGTQDFGIENYYTQVKNRSGKFTPSAVKESVVKLIKQHKRNPEFRFRLYCHFNDQESGTVRKLTIDELDSILGDKSGEYTESEKGIFLDRFHIEFSLNYEEQFDELLKLIIERYPGISVLQARVRHAMYVAHLRELVITKKSSDRIVTASELDGVAIEARSACFAEGYSHHFGNESYIKLLRENIRGSLRTVNIGNRLRFFCLEALNDNDNAHLIDVINIIKSKFYAKGHFSPMVAIRGIEDISGFKRDLWDSGVRFFDGSRFRDDVFRPYDFINSEPIGTEIRIIEGEQLSLLAPNTRVHHFFDFFRSSPASHTLQVKISYEMHVQATSDIGRILT
ncbi:hypothetical protein GCM10010156_52990 [Planobispora rosea]|uniref:Uncharacterized protein n=1 Tax=Planobispora rosea TaxID=35762 RepID=A0A8J3SBA5_PLARO|nr:hypothetical protein [Planobispora rosea]GGS87936.1 hypothetical protein GCM10010156_52990 [Planobispora rosea]GIH88569.1 hypothetical protein Pro02_69770 [Planobispora rosea]